MWLKVSLRGWFPEINDNEQEWIERTEHSYSKG